jgi:hypothetical protein
VHVARAGRAGSEAGDDGQGGEQGQGSKESGRLAVHDSDLDVGSEMLEAAGPYQGHRRQVTIRSRAGSP